jgi:mitogen-activated protein kinase 1/3
VFDFVDTDLSKIFKSDQHMLIGHVQFIFYQLLLGLKHMHSANVIHRDIKPANILISCTDCSVKIADFGLSRVIGEDAMVSRRGSASGVKDSLFERPSDAGRPSDFLPMVPGEPSDVTLPPVPGTDAVCPKANEAETGAGAETEAGAEATLGPPIDLTQGDRLGPPMPLSDPAHPHPQGEARQRGTLPLRRQLTHHVVTRWYRAPEVILSQPYNASVDVWSVGCIFAELLGMVKENVGHYRQRRPLFPGESCGELSPDGCDTSFHDGTKEQLSVIFEVIGTPSDSQLTHLKPSTAHELRGFRKREPENLRQRYPACDEVCLDLLTQLLAFDPASRITVDDALRHPFLQAFHSEEKEAAALASDPMSVEIETVGEDADHLFDNVSDLGATPCGMCSMGSVLV